MSAGRAREDRYLRARADPVAVVILRALHRQDMRSLDGDRGDMGGLALITAAKVRAVVLRGATT
jgi:hypothetical protein